MTDQSNMPKEFIAAAYDRVMGLLKWRPYIEKALKRNDSYLTYEEVCQKVLAGTLLWFNNDDAFVIAEIITFSKGTYCHVCIAGGKFEDICNIEKEQVVPLLQMGGIKRMTMLARDGFTRRGLSEGWKPTKQHYYTKEI